MMSRDKVTAASATMLPASDGVALANPMLPASDGVALANPMLPASDGVALANRSPSGENLASAVSAG
jgi:hypothetical protein